MAEVEVFIASYNRRRYLAEALDSVLAQTFDDIHVLVVDDASTDGAADLARQYEGRHRGRVTVLCKAQNRGVRDSVNLALRRLENAPFIAFGADDDRWHPEKIERQIEVFRADPSVGLVATDAALIDPEGRLTGRRFSDISRPPDPDSPARSMFERGSCLCGTSVMVRGTALDLFGGGYPLEGDCTDLYMWLLIASQHRIRWLAEPLTEYRIGHTSLSSERARAHRRESFELRRHAFDHHAAVRLAVGGRDARRRLSADALYWALWHLRRGEWRESGWYARRTGTPGVAAALALRTLATSPRAAGRPRA